MAENIHPTPVGMADRYAELVAQGLARSKMRPRFWAGPVSRVWVVCGSAGLKSLDTDTLDSAAFRDSIDKRGWVVEVSRNIRHGDMCSFTRKEET